MRVAFVPRSAEIQPLFWRFVNFTLHPSHYILLKGARSTGYLGGGGGARLAPPILVKGYPSALGVCASRD